MSTDAELLPLSPETVRRQRTFVVRQINPQLAGFAGRAETVDDLETYPVVGLDVAEAGQIVVPKSLEVHSPGHTSLDDDPVTSVANGVTQDR